MTDQQPLPIAGHLYGDPCEPWNQWNECVGVDNGVATFRSIRGDVSPWYVPLDKWRGFSGALEMIDLTSALQPKPAGAPRKCPCCGGTFTEWRGAWHVGECKPAGETVRVRAAVLVGDSNEDDWVVYGLGGLTDKETVNEADTWIEGKPVHVAWIEASVSKQPVHTIEATVVEPKET